MRAQTTVSLTTLHIFSGGLSPSASNDGGQPNAALIQGSDGNFYGTTEDGGTGGTGTVFQITPAGVLTTLHSFTAAEASGANSDGVQPEASLLQGRDGNFYGTTYLGGPDGRGTVFQITPAGALTTLHSFDDNGSPGSALIQDGAGNFYGMTGGSNPQEFGTVFQITPAGALTTLHTFVVSDGANPQAGLVLGRDGNFYGTTEYGGTNNLGTVFQITPAGVLTTLHDFTGGDGERPLCNLIQGSDGDFYGTTFIGGAGDTGTVFKITSAGTLTTLHDFGTIEPAQGANSDGNGPDGGLILGSDGNFYGTTEGGGTKGIGTVFQITPAGTLTSLHSFISTDGGFPYAGVVQSGGSFYGTTRFFGSPRGEGTVFRLTLTQPLTVTSPTSATGVAGHPFTYQITATHSPTAFTASGLPAGLSVDPSTGFISGVPTGAGESVVGLTASNNFGTGSATLSLVVQPALTITSAASATATAGQPFTYRITATNSPIAFQASDLPAGLRVDTSTGLISGVPTTAGNYAVTLSARNTFGTASAALGLIVQPALAITSPLSAAATVGVDFSYQITATHSPTAFTADGLPTGLGVDASTGAITGVPVKAGSYTVTLSASNAFGTASAALGLVVGPALTITSPPSARAVVGQKFTYQITATHSPTAFAASGLPVSLSVDPSTGTITGVPTVAGTYAVTIQASNAFGTATAALALTAVIVPPVITSALTGSAEAGVPFTYQIAAANVPTSFGAQGLPTGLSVNGSTGVISGTPATAGVFPLQLNAYNPAGTGSATLVLTVAVGVPVITSADAASRTVGAAFGYLITATNAPTSFGVTGLPEGLSFDPTTGVILGAPVVAGVYTLGLTATNGSGMGSGTLTLTVLAAPVVTASTAGDGLAVAGGEKGKVLVRRTGDTSAALTVRYKVKGSATAGVDYKPLGGSVTIPAGAQQVKLKIKPLDHAGAGGTRITKVKLLPSTDGGYTLGSPAVAKIRIIDGD